MPSVFSINPQQVYHHDAHDSHPADVLPLRTNHLSYHALKGALLAGPLRLSVTQLLLNCFFIGAGPRIRSLINRICKYDDDLRPKTLKRRAAAFVALRQMARRRDVHKFEISVLLHAPVDGTLELCYHFCIDGHELITQHFSPNTTEHGMILLDALPDPHTVHGDVLERLLDTRDNLLLSNLSIAFSVCHPKSPLVKAQPADLTPTTRAHRLFTLAAAFKKLNRQEDYFYGFGGLLFRKIALLHEAFLSDTLISSLEMHFHDRHALTLSCGNPIVAIYAEDIDHEKMGFEDFAVAAATLAIGAETVSQRVSPSRHHDVFESSIAAMAGGDPVKKVWIRTHLQSELFGHARFIKFIDHDDGTFTAMFHSIRQRFSNKARARNVLSGEMLKEALTTQFASLERIIAAKYHAELLDDARHIVTKVQAKIRDYGLHPIEEESVYAKLRFIPVLAFFFDDLRQP